MARKKTKVEEEEKEELVEEVSEEESEEVEDDSDEEIEEDEEIEDEEDESEEEIVESKSENNTINDKTRYIIIAIVSVILVGLICVLAFVGNDKNKENSSSNTQTARDTSTDALKEFYKQFDSKDLNVIFFASSTCGYCSLEKPILKNIADDNDMKYYEIDASALSKTELNEIISALGIQGATPTTVIVKEGKVVATNEGYLDGKPYTEFFVKNGVLKKGTEYKEEKNLKVISYQDFKDIAKKDKKSIFLLDSSACQNCITVRSMLNELAEKNDFEVNYLFAANLSQDDVQKLVEQDLKDMGYDEKSYKNDGTVSIPLLLIVKNNKIKDYVVTSAEKSDYTKVLKKYDFID